MDVHGKRMDDLEPVLLKQFFQWGKQPVVIVLVVKLIKLASENGFQSIGKLKDPHAI